MKDREYKDAWQELKDKFIEQYIKVKSTQEETELQDYQDVSNSVLIGIKVMLLEMDKTDKTNEFKNVLIDRNEWSNIDEILFNSEDK